MNPENLAVENAQFGVRIIKIARPKALNALNARTLSELREVLTEAAADPGVRVVVLTGEGEKAFIAGADIMEMKDKTVGEAVGFSQLGHEIARQLEFMPKPTIAAVNGFALGGGCEMALACDFILASDKAVFGQPEVGIGVIPGFGGTIRLAKVVGNAMAKDLIFSGRKIDAQEALRIGLVNQVFPAADFMKQVMEIATTIARNSASAIYRAKKLLNEFSETVGLTSKIDAEAHSFGMLFGSHDQREGMTAFTEKRKPKFEGLDHDNPKLAGAG